jgi:hypothetical protein
MSGYKHYPGHGGEEGLIGHVRGTFISADAPDEARQLIQPRLLSDEKIFAKLNSMIIEEIQSDAQKGKAQSGALRQAQATGRPWTDFLKPETQNYVRVVGRAADWHGSRVRRVGEEPTEGESELDAERFCQLRDLGRECAPAEIRFGADADHDVGLLVDNVLPDVR